MDIVIELVVYLAAWALTFLAYLLIRRVLYWALLRIDRSTFVASISARLAKRQFRRAVEAARRAALIPRVETDPPDVLAGPRRPPEPDPPAGYAGRLPSEPFWSMSLLVHGGEDEEALRPGIQLLGDPLPPRALIRIEVRDEADVLRLQVARELPSDALDSEVPIPPMMPPDGVGTEEMLGWRWDVVIEDSTGERARWTERLSPAGRLNAEAEMAMHRSTSPPEAAILRRIFGSP